MKTKKVLMIIIISSLVASFFWVQYVNYLNRTPKPEIVSLITSSNQELTNEINLLKQSYPTLNKNEISERKLLEIQIEILRQSLSEFYPDTKSWSDAQLWNYILQSNKDGVLNSRLNKNPNFLVKSPYKSSQQLVRAVESVIRMKDFDQMKLDSLAINTRIVLLKNQIRPLPTERFSYHEKEQWIIVGLIVINALWIIVSAFLFLKYFFTRNTSMFNVREKKLISLVFVIYLLFSLCMYLLRIPDKAYSKDYFGGLWHHFSIRIFDNPDFHLVFFSSSIVFFWLMIAGINWVRSPTKE
jgi:membrane-associated HD superfamily phosphohydrolase